MKALFLSVFIALIFTVAAQQCRVGGPYACEGGVILTVELNEDSATLTQSDEHCTLIQNADYDVDPDGFIRLGFGDLFNFDFFDCNIINEDEKGCQQECYEDDVILSYDPSDCTQIFGPNGETCNATKSTLDCEVRSCPAGQTLVDDPSNEPTANGCGPSSIPFSAPSLSFEECCNQHDLCYGSCTTPKKTCDDNFYACMHCSCKEEYSDLTDELCLELACSYYELVDEFGCAAFQSSQANRCVCSGSLDKDEVREYVDVPSKFGPPGAMSSRQTRALICEEPFKPECPNTSEVSSGSSASSGSSGSSGVSSGSSVSTGSSASSGTSEGNVVAYSIVFLILVMCMM